MSIREGEADREVTQLLYVSVSTADVSSGLQMSDILAEARPANARDDITGVLTAVSGRFVQIIEGEAKALDGLLVRLGGDRRHTDIRIRERRTVRHRMFGDWDMVSPRLAPVEILQIGMLIDDDDAGLDEFADALRRALNRQGAVIEGRTGLDTAGLDAPPAPTGAASKSRTT
ncbi:MAG: BLUF domain-containing protein [Alphaproteobacteria bacterium]|nr:BLUF domain-containing protein [Alphaproteobacteria bacterium]MBU2380617.1 BLUF domain-containing protein [Alphaproteobacteria bacterium]